MKALYITVLCALFATAAPAQTAPKATRMEDVLADAIAAGAEKTEAERSAARIAQAQKSADGACASLIASAQKSAEQACGNKPGDSICLEQRQLPPAPCPGPNSCLQVPRYTCIQKGLNPKYADWQQCVANLMRQKADTPSQSQCVEGRLSSLRETEAKEAARRAQEWAATRAQRIQMADRLEAEAAAERAKLNREQAAAQAADKKRNAEQQAAQQRKKDAEAAAQAAAQSKARADAAAFEARQRQACQHAASDDCQCAKYRPPSERPTKTCSK